MRPGYTTLAALALITLGACAPMGVRATSVKDFMLYGLNDRELVFFGDQVQGTQTLKVADQPAELSQQTESFAPLTGLRVTGALQVNHAASLTLPLANNIGQPIGLGKSPIGPAVALTTRAPVTGVAYYDGSSWRSVSAALAGNLRVKVNPEARTTLRGLGNLSDAEADGLAAYLVAKVKGPMAVAFLPDDTRFDPAPTFDPTPRSYTRVPVYVQQGVPLDALVDTALDLTTTRRLAAGANSGYSEKTPTVVLDRSLTGYTTTWNLIQSIVLPRPAVPTVVFGNETAVTFFLGQKPTGGYSVGLVKVEANGSALTLTVRVAAPRPGLIVTQALTSPFLSLAVPGVYTSVKVLDADTGQVLATAP